MELRKHVNRQTNWAAKLMRSTLVVVFAACGLLLTASAGAQTLVPKPPDVSAPAYMLVDFTSGLQLAGDNVDARLEPASLTKMMTAYVVFAELTEGNIALDDLVLISEKAWRTGGSKMFVEVDKQVDVESLLKGVIVQSGNDASVALAEFIAGDESAFANLMNQYAVRLGMKDSNFQNSTGLPDDDHYTTAADLVTLSIAMIRDFPTFYQWHAIKSFKWNDIDQRNRNKLLWRDDSVDGIKTGYTSSAGYCMVTSALREDMRLIAVVLGSKSQKIRAKESQALLNFGFRFYETHEVYARGAPLTKVRVWKGEREELDLGLMASLAVTVPRGQFKKLEATVEVDADIVAPVAKGETHGRVVLQLGDEQIAQRPLVALTEIPEGGLWRKLQDNVKLLFH